MKHLSTSNIRRVYMLGIGGIGMSAIARYFNAHGIAVSGYDKVATSLTSMLEKEGVNIHYEESIEKVDTIADLVVYSPAIPQNHMELCYYQKVKHPHILRRKEVLGLIANNSAQSVCIAGTHGKTSISAITAYLLRETNIGGTAFLGGIASNYNTNYWSQTDSPCVVEADEYDQAFLELNPFIASISSTDPDHLDIYESKSHLEENYISFSNKIQDGGILFYHKNIERANEFASHLSRRYDYHISDQTAYVHARSIRTIRDGYTFDVHIGKHHIPQLTIHIGGKHNIENAMAAIAINHILGANDELIREALERFEGIDHRFDIAYRTENHVLLSDYAHHPSEINAFINGLNDLFPLYKKVLVFQPHLYSRTQDFAEGFANELDKVDVPLLLDIYPARESPIPGISSKTITEKMQHSKVQIVTRDAAINCIKTLPSQKKYVIAIVGAGNIDTLIDPIKKLISNNND